MEPLTITIASILVAKIADELLAKSKNEKVKKYIGIFSLIARLWTGRK